METDNLVRPRIYLADEHDIDFEQIDRDALYVIERLQDAGFVAYLVGGGVRDLLVKKKPKDFDVSTSAKPEEIKHLFRKSCLLIGKRFRLAHVRFGKKIIEVSTFRSGESAGNLIVRDNEWGSPEEDALRRDFTINGLFYDPTEHHVIDYIGGWDDIHQHTLRTIGDPIVRFRQDPVRMIRLLKFQARFGFHIEEEAAKAVEHCYAEIAKSAPARVLEEIFRMLESGAAEAFFRLLHQHRMLELLFPWLARFLDTPRGEDLYQLLAAADKIHQDPDGNSTIDRAILTACLHYPILSNQLHTKYIERDIVPHIGDVSTTAAGLAREISGSSFSEFPKRLRVLTHFILALQYRLTPVNQPVQIRPKITQHPDFPLALQFLQLRAMGDASLRPTYEEWATTADEHEPCLRSEDIRESHGAPRQPQRRRPRGPRRRPNAHGH
ncbi:MAG: polynucleotide adenylyltransferase PcnB [Nitrosomonas sp.]|nr:MAG: polynucleotide adenylyltransferase PcnB [Nitrosomonas sp.]